VSLQYYARGYKCCTVSSHHGGDEDAGLTASVGEGGRNAPDDVRVVQSKLNGVSTDQGGPLPLLDVDGICGPKTKGAILHFQRRYPAELISDGRIDRDKNTWKKLVAVSGDSGQLIIGAKAPKSPSKPHPAVDDATQQLFATYLFLVRWRIFETIKAIDESIEELKLCQTHVDLHPEMSLFQAYQHWEIKLTELPTFHRCFHIAGDKMKYAHAMDVLTKVRRVYVTMVEVIFANSITTPKAEKSHSREFLRVVDQKFLDWAHGKDKAIADAPLGGWWFKNANKGRIRYGSGHVDDSDAFTTLIHEMAHFVSHASTFQINHEGGIYNAAFKVKPHQAVRNAFCYEWYALLGCFKHLRDTPNDNLELA
jgi:hypothetical protein